MITASCLDEKHRCTGCACWCHKYPKAAAAPALGALQIQANMVKSFYDYDQFRKAQIDSMTKGMAEKAPSGVIDEVKMHHHDHSDRCLNPDAVAVKWYECALCGRTRSVTVSTEVW